MTIHKVMIKIPATTANLGPGFDCLGLALDLWNRNIFTLTEEGYQVIVQGEGEGKLPTDGRNLIIRAFAEFYKQQGRTLPAGLKIESVNGIPLGSGLGSSTSAVLAGIMAANAFLGEPLNSRDFLRIANDMEGHADNAAAALFGGLVAVSRDSNDDLKVHKLDCAFRTVVVVLPDYKISTVKARQALPKQVDMKDAIFNIGHTISAIEALRSGNRDLLMQGLQDRLHQPYRLDLIPGAKEAIQAARDRGAPAVLSGAGPSVLAFPPSNPDTVIGVMQNAFKQAGLDSRAWSLKTTYSGIYWDMA